MDTKCCRSCGQTRLISEFYKHSGMSAGVLNDCKPCSKAKVMANRLANIEYYRQFDRNRNMLPHRVEARKKYIQTDAGKAAHNRATSKYYRCHQDRRAAHIIFGNAVKYGRVIRQPCVICGKKADGHHPDYAKPLEVIWLCRKHHVEAHKLAKGTA